MTLVLSSIFPNLLEHGHTARALFLDKCLAVGGKLKISIEM